MEKRAAELIQAEERIARLEEAICEARETVEAERFERELLVREKAAALQRIKELEAEGAAYERIPDPAGGDHHNAELEKRLAEMDGVASQIRKSDVVDERIAGLQQALQRAEERIDILRLEVERLAAAKTAAEKRLMEREQAPRKEAAPPRSIGVAASSGAGEPGLRAPIVRRPPPKGAFFHADWDLAVIEYDSPDDILEVHLSMNLTQLSLEGYHSQHCSAWIVALKKGKNRQVHVVFGLLESGLNMIYSPAKPIRNKDDYKKALSEAAKFLKVVGYFPEKMPLDKSVRNDALNSIPALQRSRKRAQGF